MRFHNFQVITGGMCSLDLHKVTAYSRVNPATNLQTAGCFIWTVDFNPFDVVETYTEMAMIMAGIEKEVNENK